MDTSNKLEYSCPKSVAKNSVPGVRTGRQMESQTDARNLCGKPSFFICKGKRIPDLNEVTSISDLDQMQAGEEAIQKIQGIVKRQSRIMAWVDCLLFRKKEVAQGLSQSEDLQTDESIGNDDF